MERLPDFVVVGAPKCGTTSLFYALRRHPEVFVPVRKELHFFAHDELRAGAAGPGDAYVLANLCATWEDYRAHYADAGGALAIGEVSPSYLFHHAARHRIRERLGSVRIVAILRDPVEKAHSQYLHLVREGRETLSFPDALAAEDERRRAGWGDIWRYAEGARYAEGIERYRATFGPENVRVLLYDDLVADAPALLRELFAFLGVDPGAPVDASRRHLRGGAPRVRSLARLLAGDGVAKRVAKRLLPERVRVPLRLRLTAANTGARPPLDPVAAERLRAACRDDVERLEVLLGRELGWAR